MIQTSRVARMRRARQWSDAGLVGTAFMSAYNMTKGGMRLFTKSVAHECGLMRNGVRVNSVHPGVVNTPMVDAELPKWTAVGFGAPRHDG